MTRDCIFYGVRPGCGQRPGSREHVLFASLGGRRCNRKIVCDECNAFFSALDAVLAGQLGDLNRLLGVRSDHDSAPRAVRVEQVATGRAVDLEASGQVRLADPVELERSEVNGEERVRLLVNDEPAIQEWRQVQRQAGYRVKELQRSVTKGHFVEPLELTWVLGGPDGMRSIGRLLLNFLAQEIPDLARDPGIVGFKKFVLGEGGLELAWPDQATSPTWATPSPFELGHRVVLGTDGATGEIRAHVAFFGQLGFSACFGRVTIAESQTVVIDVNALAEAPDDIHRQSKAGEAPLIGPPLTHDRWMEVVRRGLDAVLRRVTDRHWAATSAVLLPKLQAVTADPHQVERIAEVLRNHSQRLLNLVIEALLSLPEAMPSQVREAVRSAVLGDAVAMGDPPTEQASEILDLMRWAIAGHVAEMINADNLTDYTLRQVVAGQKGVDIAVVVIGGSFLRLLKPPTGHR